MVFIKRFILMMQFLTVIPLPVRLDAKDEDFGKGLVFAPVAGLVIGGILAGCYWALRFVFPVYLAAISVVVIYIILTGGLHMDGLGDTFDGLFSNRSKQRILEIMRDSRVGTNAVLAIASVMLIDVALISAINSSGIIKVLILTPVAGRIGSLVGAGTSTYARNGEGLGKSFIDYCGIKEVIVGLMIYFVLFYLVGGTTGLLISIIPVITAYLITHLLCMKIGGATGDILGAVCELNQVVFLIAAFLIFG